MQAKRAEASRRRAGLRSGGVAVWRSGGHGARSGGQLGGSNARHGAWRHQGQLMGVGVITAIRLASEEGWRAEKQRKLGVAAALAERHFVG